MNPCDFRILVCGCFDMFHVGHLRLLKGAHQFGNVYVRIGDDKSIQQKKGQGRPVCTAEERLQILKACRYVYDVAVFEFYEDPVAAHKKLLEELQPSAYAEGPYHNNEALYPLLIERNIPRIIIPNKIQGTTNILAKVNVHSDMNKDTCDVWDEMEKEACET